MCEITHQRPLPYGRQTVGEDDVDAVVSALRSDFLTTGPRVEAFETALCESEGVGHAVVVNSGTAALHAACFAAGLGPGDEVVTSPLTFASTANVALHLGASVRFADVDADTGILDPAAADAACTPQTRLIVPIDFTGRPADYDAIRRVAQARGVAVIADAAHSLGAIFRGKPAACLPDAAATSFHPVKPITAAEGGAVLTDHPDWAGRAASFRTHGIRRGASELSRPDVGPWWYEMHDLGLNYRLSDLHCALGLSQLRKLAGFIDRRRDIARLYRDALHDQDEIMLPPPDDDVYQSGWHLYVIRLRDVQRRRTVFERLRSRGILVQVHYIPVHHHPFYIERFGDLRGSMPRAEAYYAGAISLPIFPAMTDADVARVVDELNSAVAA